MWAAPFLLEESRLFNKPSRAEVREEVSEQLSTVSPLSSCLEVPSMTLLDDGL